MSSANDRREVRSGRAHPFGRQHHRRLGLLAAAAAAVAFGSAGAAFADDVWNQGAGSAAWDTASHWTPTGVPGAGATVDIVNKDSNARTVTYNYPTTTTTLGQLNISNTGASNSLTLSTAGLVLTISGDEFIGGNNSGTTGIGVVNQFSGTQNIGAFMDLGANAGDKGYFNLAGGTLNMYQAAAGASIGEFIGINGTGTLAQLGGNNNIVNGQGTLALASGSVKSQGLYTLSAGTLSALSSNPLNEIIGLAGTGTFTQSGGLNRFSNAIVIGDEGGSLGKYTLNGAGTLDATAGNEFLGYSTGATGTFTQSAGLNNLNGYSLIVGNTGGSGSYTLSGDGSLSVGYEAIAYNGIGSVNQSGGENSAAYLGVGSGGTGTFTLSGDGTLSVSGAEFVGITGPGTITQSGGSNIIAAGSDLDLGLNYGYAPGAYVLSGDGTLSVGGSEVIGYSGVGTFVQSGGLNTFSDELDIGETSNSQGNYTLSGVGTLTTTTGSEIIGNGAGSTGTFLQTGGANFLIGGNLYIGDLGAGSYNLTAGTLNISNGAMAVGLYGTGTFTQTGGTTQLTGNTNLEIAVFAGSTGAYTLSAGTLSVGGGLYVGGGTAGPGGTGVFTVSNSGRLSVTGAMTVFNSGQVNLDVPSTTVGNLTISGQGIVNLNGALTINYGAPGNDPVTSIVSYLQSGFNGGNWSGTSGIISTSAAASFGQMPSYSVGYADGNNPYDLSKVPGLQPNEILVAYTVAGDANLDGTVNFEDLLIVAQNFNKTGEDWVGGNFVYNPTGLVNFADLLLVAQNFNKTVPLGLSAQLPASITEIPEPASTALLLASSAGILAARRRRRSY